MTESHAIHDIHRALLDFAKEMELKTVKAIAAAYADGFRNGALAERQARQLEAERLKDFDTAVASEVAAREGSL